MFLLSWLMAQKNGYHFVVVEGVTYIRATLVNFHSEEFVGSVGTVPIFPSATTKTKTKTKNSVGNKDRKGAAEQVRAQQEDIIASCELC